MSDLISRKMAIDAVAKWFHDVFGIKESDGTATIFKRLRELPSAQTEIIRCKDCKWSVEHYDTDGNVPYWVCKNWDGGTDADGYCHEAERRER